MAISNRTNNSKHEEPRNSVFKEIPKTNGVNINFVDLKYQVKLKNETKIILNSVSGEFQAGDLSAIIGPSGSGKSTLINLLAGYRIHKTSGRIDVNDRPQDMTKLKEISRYIFQDDFISSNFTIMETMRYASKFKLNKCFDTAKREKIINEYLDAFLLTDKSNTMISNISGGERKRLCVALELLNNPPVLFLDEPTTGLDEFSATQCVKLLKRLALSGRTIICSLHCPSASLFQMLDRVYVLSEGECIYQGAVNGIVPYLENFDLNCPKSHNPADYIIEVATDFHGNNQDVMVKEIQNGKESYGTDNSRFPMQTHNKEVSSNINGDQWEISWWTEYYGIFCRNLHQMWRDQTNWKLMIYTNIFISSLLGLTYHNIGNDAVYGLYNYNLVVLVSVLYIFLGMSPMLAYVPQEMQYFRREHFNQWYRLSSYFMALVSCQFIASCIMTFLACTIIYVLCDQPWQLFRYLLYFGISLLTYLTASSYGLLIGSRMRLLNALFMGPNVIAIWVMFANYAVEKTHLSTWENLLMYSSFVRHALEGQMRALFDFNRPDFICPPDVVICLATKPVLLLKISGVSNFSFVDSALFLFGFYLLFTTMAWIVFRCRLSTMEFLQNIPLYQYMRYLQTKYKFGTN
ncbi:ATP-binding cassette sub-family G member 4-like [Haematobia irritans]|uniref:ATP-binding cassette sub-family G member 4-like n=1 Tax=Haematobia irritans TaxID=7368 RepID=UPI003F5026A3